MKIKFLGTNGWYDSNMGNTICILIETPRFYLVLDAGNGIAKLDQHILDDRPVYLFISHFHLDHIVGIHTLTKNKFSHGLYFLVGQNQGEILMNFMKQPFTLPYKALPFETKIIELPTELDDFAPLIKVKEMKHSTFTLGIRIEEENRSIVYLGDTGYCENAVLLSENADVLIAECANLPGEFYEEWPHLNPETAAALAKEAGVKKLVLSHFDANRYPDKQSRDKALKIAQKVFPDTLLSYDEMDLSI